MPCLRFSSPMDPEQRKREWKRVMAQTRLECAQMDIEYNETIAKGEYLNQLIIRHDSIKLIFCEIEMLKTSFGYVLEVYIFPQIFSSYPNPAEVKAEAEATLAQLKKEQEEADQKAEMERKRVKAQQEQKLDHCSSSDRVCSTEEENDFSGNGEFCIRFDFDSILTVPIDDCMYLLVDWMQLVSCCLVDSGKKYCKKQD